MYEGIRTPFFLVDESLLIKNLEILQSVQERAGCKILLAQKCFSMFSVYPLIGQYVSGTTASGLYEAKLGREYMGKENHVYAAAYRDDEMDELISVSDHIIFNSFSQWERYGKAAKAAGKSCGLRINPECSTQEGHEIYDPCAPFSRMGITLENFREDQLEGIDGLHFHTLCEQNADDLYRTIQAVEEKFGKFLHRMKWINFGGGHHITRKDYDIELLIDCVSQMKKTYDLEVYLEPGEAFALNAGYLVTSVLDVIQNGKEIAILDTSAACHMPDVLEMPYRPGIVGAGEAEQKACTYRLGGPTCLAGDVIGDYSFDQDLKVGDRLVFEDMAIYSMVKTNTFNGIRLPSIALLHRDGTIEMIREFGYEDFKNRLS